MGAALIPIMIGATAVGTATSAVSQVKAGNAARRVGDINARSIEETSAINAQLVEEGSEANAQISDFNAALNEARARDAIYRGREEERRFREDVRGLIGAQRASYAGQGVDVSDGSPLDVQTDTAYQGELDALTIRVNAAREAWGYSAEAMNDRFEAASTRRLGKLQARGIRTASRYDALSARMGGQQAQSASRYGAAGSILGGAGSIASTILLSRRA